MKRRKKYDEIPSKKHKKLRWYGLCGFPEDEEIIYSREICDEEMLTEVSRGGLLASW
jgi:hypothetical protein